MHSALVLNLYNLSRQYVLEVHYPTNELSIDGSHTQGAISHPNIPVRADQANLFV
jgi:hypothetical protein